MIKQIDFESNLDLITFQKNNDVEILSSKICEKYVLSFDSKFHNEYGKGGKIVKKYFTRILYKLAN